MAYESYEKIIRLSEYKYIKQENIDEAYINVTSAEMYSEVQEYNRHVLSMQKSRCRFRRDFWGLMVLNLIVFLGGVLMMTSVDGKGSLLYRISGKNIRACLICIYILFFALMYFILFRKIYNWRLGLILSAMLVPVNLMFVFAAIVNPFILHMMEKIDDSMRGDAGYPGFAQLVTSYIRDEEWAEDGVMDEAGEKPQPEPKYSFDKYKIKPEDDRGMLVDQDIFD